MFMKKIFLIIDIFCIVTAVCFVRNAKPGAVPQPKLALKLPAPRPPQRRKSSGSQSPTPYEQLPLKPGIKPPKPVLPPRFPTERRSPTSPSTPDNTQVNPVSLRSSGGDGITTPQKPQVRKPLLPPPKPPGGQTVRSEPTPDSGFSLCREPAQTYNQKLERAAVSQPKRVAPRPPVSPTSKPLPPLFHHPGPTDAKTKPHPPARPLAKRLPPIAAPRPSSHDESES